MLPEKLKLSDFNFYCLSNDILLKDDLERKGLKIYSIPALKGENNKDFSFKYDNTQVSLVYLQNLIKKLSPEEQDMLILGVDNFQLDMFFEYRNREEIFKQLNNNWKHFAKRCQWNYVLLVKMKDKLYIIEYDIETRIHYPEKRDEEDLFQLIIMANSDKHFVHLNEFNEEEKKTILPKAECFRRLENYFINNFYNCVCFDFKNNSF